MKKLLQSLLTRTPPAVDPEESPSHTPEPTPPSQVETQFRGAYDGAGVWYNCGHCDAIHPLDEDCLLYTSPSPRDS